MVQPKSYKVILQSNLDKTSVISRPKTMVHFNYINMRQENKTGLFQTFFHPNIFMSCTVLQLAVIMLQLRGDIKLRRISCTFWRYAYNYFIQPTLWIVTTFIATVAPYFVQKEFEIQGNCPNENSHSDFDQLSFFIQAPVYSHLFDFGSCFSRCLLC